MSKKIKLRYILLAISLLCVIFGTFLIFSTPLKNKAEKGIEKVQLVIDRKIGIETARLLRDRKIGNAHRLNMINAYGNNSAFHPSVVNFSEEWNGYKYWMAHTPYPNADDGQENPHIMVSNDLEKWVEPAGFKNPLEPVPENYEHTKVYNSDVELVYNEETKELECWWRFVEDRKLIIYRKTTKDGVNWSEREVVLESEDRYKRDYISLALVYEDDTYKMWYVDTPYSVYYIESTDLETWTEPIKLNIEYKNPKLQSWHLDVIHNDGLYEMVINAFIEGKNRRTMSLYYSKSTDNVIWTRAEKILKPSPKDDEWDNKGLYRASLMYEGDKCYMFYSGISKKSKTVYEGVGIMLLSDRWKNK